MKNYEKTTRKVKHEKQEETTDEESGIERMSEAEMKKIIQTQKSKIKSKCDRSFDNFTNVIYNMMIKNVFHLYLFCFFLFL